MSQPFSTAPAPAIPAQAPAQAPAQVPAQAPIQAPAQAVKPIGFDPNLIDHDGAHGHGNPPVVYTYQPQPDSHQQGANSTAPPGVPAAGASPIQPIGFQQPPPQQQDQQPRQEKQGAPPKVEIYQPATGSGQSSSAPSYQP